jgi:hypothetical protein
LPWRASCIWGWLIRRGRARWRWRAAADRGDILDRNGMSLARAFPAYALW